MKLINQKPIAILLGAYNGEKFIEAQIESLLLQTNKEWTLYIRDDNSKDNTKQLINIYSNNNNNIVVVDDKKGNLGCMNNFFELLSIVDSKYYMFCDQDDIWLPNKIELTLKKMKKFEYSNFNKPIIVHTDLKVVDKSMDVISNSFWKFSKINPNLLKSFNYLAVSHLVTGCTMMFNSLVKDIVLPVPKEATLHDSYISLKTIKEGGAIISFSVATVLYRQHCQNVVGAQNYHQNYLWSKFKNLKRVFRNNYTNYKMVNQIQKTSLFTYVFYKISYLLKR
jgi:glycosyltransferase involved in cell wall biosynthesis